MRTRETSTTPISAGRATTLRHKQSRRSLEYTAGNFLMQMIEDTTRGHNLMDLGITNKEEMVRDVKAGAALAVVTMR